MVDKILKKLNKNIDVNQSVINPVFLCGIAGALLTSLFDPLINILCYGTTGIKSFFSIFLLIILIFFLFLATYFILLLILYSVFEKIFPLNLLSLAMSLSFFLAITSLLPSILQSNTKMIIILINLIRNISHFFKETFLIILFALLISLIVYIFIKLTAFRRGLKERIVSSSLSIPFLLLETFFFVWICIEFLKEFWSLNFLFITMLYLIIVSTTALLFRHPQKSSGILKFISSFLILFVFGLIFKGMSNLAITEPEGQYLHKKHKIRHIILLSVDTLRKDMLSCYGNKRFKTDNIDKLAEDGIIYKNAISSSCWTIPSFASIMTGLYPHIHQMTEKDSRLNDKCKTLAEYFSENGYYTAAIGNNIFLSIKSNNIFQGFNYTDFYPKKTGQSSYITQLIGGLFPHLFLLNANTTELTDLAINWIKENKDKDFFLWFHYIDPHVPYEPPEEYLPKVETPEGLKKVFNEGKSVRYGYLINSKESREWIKGLYEGEVKYVNDNIGRFLASLKELDIYNDSLIVFLSDHGEEFWDHGGFEHGHTLYNELIDVPLIIKLPNFEIKGEVNQRVSTVSIMPTILKLCNISFNEDNISRGILPFSDDDRDSKEKNIIYSSGYLY
ncbi:MAG: hypothetical protein D6734_08875, partial [Candidatus Schekmanbacteria bacterium]